MSWFSRLKPSRFSPSRRRWLVFDSFAIFLLTCILIAPVFRLEYLENWASIESTFIADGRMLANHLPHPEWQPLWYCGTRFDYIYPPALRYGTALVSKWGGVSPARAYHLYIGVLYAFGIMAVYWLVRAGSGRRSAAWLSAMGVALLSPAYLFIAAARNDSGYLVPQRLHVLMAYGEGPHISSLSMLGAALAACFLAFRRPRRAWIALAGVACALVVSNNFYGATSLAIFFPILLWTEWLGSRNPRLFVRALAIVALAWGFCAFWLTPSYLSLTAINLHWVSRPATPFSRLIAVIFLALVAWIMWRFGRRRPEQLSAQYARSWSVFIFASTAVLAFYVLGWYYFGLQITGDSNRLVPELDLVLVLAGVETIRWISGRKILRPLGHVVALVLVLASLYPAWTYLRHRRSPFPKAALVSSQYEYVITKWVHDHLAGQRVLPSGSVRFWYNAWFDNGQADGGSMQGMINQNLMVAYWQILHGDRADLATLWLQALGTDAVVVPDKTSPEVYHDYSAPAKFRNVLPLLWDDGRGTSVYRVPRRFSGIAHVVDISRQAPLQPIRGGDDAERLRSYVDVMEAGGSATVLWNGFDSYDVSATVGSGQNLLLQETYDPAWRAYLDGQVLETRSDPLGFTVVTLPAGRHVVEMRFEMPLENRIGYVCLAIALGTFVLLCFL